jgi:hypothetical protein
MRTIVLAVCLPLGASASPQPAPLPAVTVADPGGAARETFPVSGAVPFPRGAVREADLPRLSLVGAAGNEVPVQLGVNGRWPDGSVRWLHLDFQSTQPAGIAAAYAVRISLAGRARRPDLVRKTAAGVEVDTGTLRMSFAPGRCGIRVKRGDAWFPVAEGPVESRVVVKDRASGTAAEHVLDLSGAALEENGPERATLKVEGAHVAPNGAAFSPGVVRFTFYRDNAFVRVHHTWVMSEDPHRVLVSRIGIDVPLAAPVREFLFADGRLAVRDAPVGVYQEKNLLEPTYPPRREEFDTAYRVFDGGREAARGGRYPGAVVLKGDAADCGVFLKDMWRMCPKRVSYAPGSKTLSVDFWPGDRAGDLDLRRTEEIQPRHYRDFASRDPLYRDAKYSPEKYVPFTPDHSAIGLSRTHELVLSFAPGETPARLAALHSAPFVPFAGVAWNVASGVLGKQVAPGARPELDAAAEAVAERVLREADECGWYGELVYGNVRYLYDEKRRGWMVYHPKFAWFNSEHLMFIGGNLHNVFWNLYLRTGNPKYYVFAEARGRAKADLSTVHHGPRKGEMVRHGGFDPWVGARHAAGEHASLCGLDLQYYVTGCPRMRDVLHLSGRARAARKSFNHGRAMATDLDSMMRYWLLTGDRRYFERCLEYLGHYEATLDALQSYDGYWTYRVTALQQFHEFCDDPSVRERVKKVFLPNFERVGRRGDALTAAGFAYELAPTPDHASYLAGSFPARFPKSWEEVAWGGEDFPASILMNEVAGLGALWYNAYWAAKLPAGTPRAGGTPPGGRGEEGGRPAPRGEDRETPTPRKEKDREEKPDGSPPGAGAFRGPRGRSL